MIILNGIAVLLRESVRESYSIQTRLAVKLAFNQQVVIQAENVHLLSCLGNSRENLHSLRFICWQKQVEDTPFDQANPTVNQPRKLTCINTSLLILIQAPHGISDFSD